jgi:hypothetical protein
VVFPIFLRWNLSRCTQSERLNGRSWGSRRLVYSKEVIAFSNPGSDKIVDAIPLFELEETSKMKDDDSETNGNSEKSKAEVSKSSADHSEHPELKGGEIKDKKQGDTNKVKFRHAFQLRTQSEGYNSGRQYIIQARTEEERQKIVSDIIKLSKIANDKFLAKSQFRKTQARASRTNLQLQSCRSSHRLRWSSFSHTSRLYTARHSNRTTSNHERLLIEPRQSTRRSIARSEALRNEETSCITARLKMRARTQMRGAVADADADTRLGYGCGCKSCGWMRRRRGCGCECGCRGAVKDEERRV